MAEVLIEDIRNHFGITTSVVSDEIVEFALSKAILETKQRIGETLYADLTGGSPSDVLKAGAVEEAVHCFTVARLLRNRYLPFRRGGLVKREQDSGSAAVSAASQVVNEYLTPAEMKKYAEQFREDALQALEDAGISSSLNLYVFTNCNRDPEATDYEQTIPEKTSSAAL